MFKQNSHFIDLENKSLLLCFVELYQRGLNKMCSYLEVVITKFTCTKR